MARLLFNMAFKLQKQERRLVEALDDNLVETAASSLQIGQLTASIKVENIDENVVANQKPNFQFPSLLHAETKNKNEIHSLQI